MFMNNFSVGASAASIEEIDPRNIPAKLSNISDNLYREVYSWRKFLDLQNAPEEFKYLNDDIEGSLKWKQIAVFQYFLQDSGIPVIKDPFDVSDEGKNQYGIILTNDSNVLIVFKGKPKAEEWVFSEDLSFYDSVRLYDVYPDNPKMKYARHFFDITDSYSYVNQSLLYKSTIGLLNPTDWFRWYSSANMHEKVLYAALSCQTEVFGLLDQYIANSASSVRNISLMGYRDGAGVSTILSCLLHQKFKEEGKLENQNSSEEEKVGLTIDILNFETPQIFNENSIKIFYSKIKRKNFKNILSPRDQEYGRLLGEALREVLYNGNEKEDHV